MSCVALIRDFLRQATRCGEGARETAVARAVAAGADPVGTAVVRIREVPLSYGSRRSIRVAVKAVGPLTAPR
ncbi:hypothetical protein GCM10022232_80410 [Streptomyces plumbiresistens]|uniref:Uncharacterized protein n=1 Tax=Streptomyces plumbiresistens TaxID=511811 RepID=A0ABP7T9S4_9ACTN